MKVHWKSAVVVAICLLAATGMLARDGTTTANAQSGIWHGEYYSNPWLAGAPAVVRDEPALYFDWGTGSPAAGIPADNFSARWTSIIYFDAGSYRFTTETDDGVRLFIDGNLVIDRWYDQARTSHSADVTLGAGLHAIRMEYYENQGTAFALLTWGPVQSSTGGGNIITCVRPHNSWIKVYRLDGDQWVDMNPHGYGPIDASGFLKLDGFPVDFARYGYAGQPYWVELWADGSLIRSVGNTARGEPEFRVVPGTDNYTPWGCPAP